MSESRLHRPILIAMLFVVIWGVLVASAEAAPARLKDIARIDAGGELQLVGYGLVVGLDGTGDSKSSVFTMQSMANMLSRMGVTVPQGKIRSKNAAAVMAVARLSRHHHPGSLVDVTVSSLGDASSLQGGTLLITPLATPDGQVFATAQGAISVGGFSAGGGGGDEVSQNYVLVGRVPGGGIVEREVGMAGGDEMVRVVLNDPDYTTAIRVADAINQSLGEEQANALDASTILVDPPLNEAVGGRVAFLSGIEVVEIEPDAVARIVLNERTGTIVAGERVTLSPVAIAHGNLSVEIRSIPLVSQPEPFSEGETVMMSDTEVHVDAGGTGLVPLNEAADVGDLARALNALGVSPRDLIAIFQALKEAGALRAELRII